MKHLFPEHEQTFTSNVVDVGNYFLTLVEKNDLCSVCFLTYFHTFVVDAILKEAPNKRDEILIGMQQTLSRIMGVEVSFIVERQLPTNTMEAVFDAFEQDIIASKKGKLN